MLKFDLARNALRYLIREYHIKKIHIPYYLCDVIRHTVYAENCTPRFYHIDDNFMPEESFSPEEYILYPNYFGICGKNVEKLALLYSKLIVDNAHAFYDSPSGFACFNSARKFLPVKDGAYLWFKGETRTLYPDTGRRKLFNQYANRFGKTNLLKIDVPADAVPFCYPYLAETIEEADNLAKELTSTGLTIYRYWNCLPETYNEYKFYKRLVPIPLD